MAQAGPGKIRLFSDFFNSGGVVLASTEDSVPLGDFFAGGEGFEDGGAGAAAADGLSGVLRLTSGATDQDLSFVGTPVAFDVALMGPIVVEARVQFVDLDAKAAFIGLTSVLTPDEQIDDILDAGTTTITLTAANLCGFLYSDELTDDEDWHMIHQGGTATASTVSTTVDADEDAVAGEWQVLRLEVDTNGDARWYINGVLKQTVEDAVSTSTDVAVCCGAGANSAEAAIMDVDYLLATANRDWTV